MAYGYLVALCEFAIVGAFVLYLCYLFVACFARCTDCVVLVIALRFQM